jgi:hypothetical protein
MKKLLVLMLVLGMASLASAGMIGNVLEINVGGVAVDEITAPGTYTLSITNAQQIASGSNEGYFLLVTDLANVIDSSLSTMLNGDLFIMDDAAGLGQPVPAGTNGSIAGVFDFGAAYVVGTVLFDGITLTANAPGNVAVYAVEDDGVTIGQMMDSVAITPEPATLAILGLGALLLRRK